MTLDKENLYGSHERTPIRFSTRSPSSSKLSSLKSSKERSSTSLLSLSSHTRTPKMARKSSKHPAEEKTVTIKCQRLNEATREYEEVEVEVPAPIYETLRFYNDRDKSSEGGSVDSCVSNEHDVVKSKRSLASKIKRLFLAKT